MKKFITTALCFIFILFCFWISMVCIDFSFSEQGKTPIFAKPIIVTDGNMYQGFGYIIEIAYESIAGQPGELPQSHFYFTNPFRP